MKIAIFTDTFLPDVNGVAKTLGRLTKYLDKSHHSYIVISPKLTRKEINAGQIYRQSSFPFPLYKDCRISVPNTIHLKEIIKKFQPDIIHVATPFSIGLAGLHLAKKYDIPVVGSYHTDFDHYLKYYHLTLLSKALWRYMEWFHQPLLRIFVPSAVTRDQLQQKGFQRLQIWQRGVDMNVFHPSYERSVIRQKYQIKQKYILSYVGRLAPEKNVELLPKIAEQLPPKLRKDIHWLIVGDGPSKAELTNTWQHQVTYTGFLPQKEVAQIVATSDLFIFPSETETFGNVVLEALATGTPVVAANAGGVKNIIQEGFTGKLCNSNYINSYTDSIRSILEDAEWRQQLEQNAIRYAQKQKWEDRFEELLHSYHQIVEEIKTKQKHA
ncbi:glycosyltransferase family 1 protein [Gracilibacillus caseinilyticus]|uniref:Glycosyltransferase family 1 protein n=1 Tax=Gracilibacillus caseinilyticus TaxID=2932256 RepID=A0ABY4EWE3_9BACI|nr:glycosyltransferase family 1 protein [Gracilibacillus caseinilyticus]UOQ48183.1 glycosyltransferase family 1 protein [Gracilibacillus caseinilyticus]